MLSTRRALIFLVALALAGPVHAQMATKSAFSAQLTGAASVPEPISSDATGTLSLTIDADGKKISYKLDVKNIKNASGADIHMGPNDMNGPMVVKLFPAGGAKAKQGLFSGTIAQGTITAGDLVGPLLGADMDDLIYEIRAGNTYVNIHTNDGREPPDTGPGDYRYGEIRGQIE